MVEYQVPTSSNNYTWYRLYSDGWVEQGGYIAISGTSQTKTLPVTMQNNTYNITAHPLASTFKSDTASGNRNTIQAYVRLVYNQTSTSFTHNRSEEVNQIGTYWQVSGMSNRGTTQQNRKIIKY